MVKQILARLKWMTRRLRGLKKINEWPNRYVFDKFVKDDKGYLRAHFIDTAERGTIAVKFPYGKIGDVLYVRERWNELYQKPNSDQLCTKKDLPFLNNASWRRKGYVYAADDNGDIEPPTWCPSIHMPKAAARIWLQVTEIRVERLKDISEQDAKAEGARSVQCWYADGSGQGYSSNCEGFKQVWHSVNGDQSWNDNPWVWVIRFYVLSTNGKPAALETLKQEAV